MDEPQDQRTAEQAVDAPALLLSNDERRVLALYDELRDLEVTVALIEAQQRYTPDSLLQNTEEDVRQAQQDAAKARAGWLLRNDITDSVMTANPILKAVHSSTQSTPIETDLLPHIHARDATSVTLSETSSDIRAAINELTDVEAESLRVGRRNVELTAEILRLTEEAEARRMGEIGDVGVQEDMYRLQAEVKASRQRWKVMKGTASAIVVGSGIDWTRDETLTDIVLDPEDES
ncbi:centromere protein H (CENP-H)-domain-containing protein [Colletotrichum navitas]|uniref:Centromere protein H (CENP-H)-domain-containing protein n=1 Tax=Colletotrichum navitas TaxID=681940 RepID=A0AAD8PMB3_9PEZI|nr:centromere protein H (CENP-H)-domain-containing protein [Colletotrichum navitas]KAK1570296.1 centromere protein H (CENP-H)-domain-containing protein [Colletotrichum navitas]